MQRVPWGAPTLHALTLHDQLQHNKKREELHRLQAKHPELADKFAGQVGFTQCTRRACVCCQLPVCVCAPPIVCARVYRMLGWFYCTLILHCRYDFAQALRKRAGQDEEVEEEEESSSEEEVGLIGKAIGLLLLATCHCSVSETAIPQTKVKLPGGADSSFCVHCHQAVP